jgi:hypothetical protein
MSGVVCARISGIAGYGLIDSILLQRVQLQLSYALPKIALLPPLGI